MPDTTRYFECNFDHDRLDDGTLPPAVTVGTIVLKPVQVRKGVVEMRPERVEVPAIPGTRIFATGDPVVAQVLAQTPDLREIDKPSPKLLKQQRQQSRNAADVAANTATKE